jgi:O-antigen/teichoic acid export membrane protein
VLRKLVGYAAYMFGANVFTALLTFAVTAFGMATRSKEAFGNYFTYMLVYELATGVLINGINATIQRYSADSEENRLRFTKMVFLAFGVMSVVFGIAAVISYQLDGLNLALGFFGIPWVVTGWYGRYILRSTLDAKREARLMVIASLSSSVFRFCFLTFTDFEDAMIYGDFMALVVSGAAALILVPFAVSTPVREILKVPIPKAFLMEAARFALPLWAAGLVFTAKCRLQSAWTRGRIGARAMGSLGGLQLFGIFYEKPMEFLGQASLPGLVAAKEDRDMLYRELLRFSIVALSGVAVLVAAGVPLAFLVIDEVQQFFGQTDGLFLEKYSEVPTLMLLSALALPFRAVEMVTNQYSVAVGRRRAVFYAQVVQLTVMGAALVPLAEAYGVTGVVVVGIIGEMANAFTFVVLLWNVRRGSMRSAAVWCVLAALATAVALAPAYYYREWTHAWTLSFVAAALFAGQMYAVRMLQPADFGRVLRAFKGESSE